MNKIKTRVRWALCVAALLGCALGAVAQHTPLTSWDDCPADPNTTAGRFAPLPEFVHNTPCSPVTKWPSVGRYDFCGYMDTTYCQLKVIAELVPDLHDDIIAYADMLRCLDADINGQIYEAPPAVIPVTISVNTAGQCTIYWNNILTHLNVPIPGWAPGANWYMGFGARTGGVRDYHVVDDFSLTSPVMNYAEDFFYGPGLGTLYGDASVVSRQLLLTPRENSKQGSWSFLPTAPATEFTVTFLQYMGDKDNDGADGMSFAYSPGANASFGETGPGSGLSVCFHTYGDYKDTIRLTYNGVLIAGVAPGGTLRQIGDFLPISGNDMLDGQYELALLGYVLNTASHPLHADAHAAIQKNFIEIKCIVQQALYNEGYLGVLGLFAKYFVGSISMTLAGYAALGDDLTDEALDALLILLADIGLQPPEGGIRSITDFIPLVGPHEDFEGDGFSNFNEYLHVREKVGLTVSKYMQYAQTPPSLSVQGATYYQVGTKISLSPKLALGGVIKSAEWWKDASLAGTNNTLTIDPCTYYDAGYYDLYIAHTMGNSDEVVIAASGLVTVGDEEPTSKLPAIGVMGLAALSALITLVTARRRRG